MPLDLGALVAPTHTAIVTSEVQNGVVGARSALPALAEAAAVEMLPNLGRLVPAARAAGVQVVHCTAYRRADGRGANTNARLFMGVRKAPVALLPGSPEVEVVAELGPEPERPRAHPHPRPRSDGGHRPRPGAAQPRGHHDRGRPGCR